MASKIKDATNKGMDYRTITPKPADSKTSFIDKNIRAISKKSEEKSRSPMGRSANKKALVTVPKSEVILFDTKSNQKAPIGDFGGFGHTVTENAIS